MYHKLATPEQIEDLKKRAERLPYGSIRRDLLKKTPYCYTHLTKLLKNKLNVTEVAYGILDKALKKVERKF